MHGSTSPVHIGGPRVLLGALGLAHRALAVQWELELSDQRRKLVERIENLRDKYRIFLIDFVTERGMAIETLRQHRHSLGYACLE